MPRYIAAGTGGCHCPPRQVLAQPEPLPTLAVGCAGISANVGRVSQGNNVILDTTNDEDKWRELDMQVQSACRV